MRLISAVSGVRLPPPPFKMILKKFKKTIREYRLIEKKDNVLVAYSGGVDSTGLLSLLLEIQDEWSLKIYLGHFNHKLRKKADEDEQFVRNVSQRHSLPLFVESADVQMYAKKKGLNMEEAGRELRYNFLRKIAFQAGQAKIATGHTMTDQAETLLMRLIRGSGPRGLAGIYPVVEGKIIRPLIELEREAIEDYLEKRNIPSRIDESNFDRRFFRNKVRWELLPYIRRNFEPHIVSRLARMASIFQEEEALLDELSKEKAKKTILEKRNGIFLDLGSLFSFPLALRRRVVREFISKLKGNLREISFKDIETVLRLGKGKDFHLKKDLVLRREEDLVFLKRRSTPRVRYAYSWEGKSPLEIKEVGLKFEGKEFKKKNARELEFNDKMHACIDRANLEFPLLVRNRREGDRYRPIGSPGQKKLKEIMRARGIPLSEREKRPVFISGEEIVWVLGLPVSEKYKISKKTRDVFVLKKL